MKAAPQLTLRGRDYFGRKGLHGLGIVTGSKVQRRKREESASEGGRGSREWTCLATTALEGEEWGQELGNVQEACSPSR